MGGGDGKGGSENDDLSMEQLCRKTLVELRDMLLRFSPVNNEEGAARSAKWHGRTRDNWAMAAAKQVGQHFLSVASDFKMSKDDRRRREELPGIIFVRERDG